MAQQNDKANEERTKTALEQLQAEPPMQPEFDRKGRVCLTKAQLESIVTNVRAAAEAPHIAAHKALLEAGAACELSLQGIANMAHRAWESPETIEEICKQIEIFALAGMEKLRAARADAT